MRRTMLTAWLVLVVGVVVMQCQPNQGGHSLHDTILSRVTRQLHLRVGVVELPPYVIIDQSKDDSDQERYTGLTIDVLKKLAESLRFRYTIELQTDDLPGQRFSNGSWDGLMERLIKSEVDIGGPLHITKDRQAVLSFTKPFVNSGISFLVKEAKLQKTPTALIFRPFSSEVWLVLLIAFIIISILFYTICRVSPYSNVPQPRVSKTKGFLSKIADPSAPYSIKNSFLYTVNTLTFQGQRNSPKSWAGRILSVFWALFCLIIIIIYAASLTSFILAGRGSDSLLKYFDITSLMAASGTRIGIVQGRYEDSELKDSTIRDFTVRRGTFLGSYSEGIRWLQESYGQKALAMDTQTAKYVALRHCDFKKFSKSMNIVGMGFGVSSGNIVMGSNELNQALIRLHEDGTITTLLKKWVYTGSICSKDIEAIAPDDTSKSSIIAHTVTLKEASSPLIFVFVGALLAIVVLLGEVFYVRCFSKKSEEPEETKLEEGDGDVTKEEVVVASP